MPVQPESQRPSTPLGTALMAPPSPPSANAGPCTVFLGVSNGSSYARTAMGRGHDLVAGASRAARLLHQHDPQSGPDAIWLKIDLIDEVLAIEAGGEDLSKLPRSLYGLADSDWEQSLLPDELVSHRVVDSRHRFRPRRLRQFSSLFPWRASKSTPDWRWRFSTVSYLQVADQPFERLFRSQPTEVSLASADLIESAHAAGHYLRRAVRDDGSYDYEYLPKSDRSDDDYNLLRHAGATYAMLELYHQIADDEILVAAEVALDYLLRQIEPCPPLPDAVGTAPVHDEANGLCAVEDDESKLGGNGLAILALLEHPHALERQESLRVARGLGERVLALLREDGRFHPHKVRWSDGAAYDFVSEYYPGEATFALTRLYRATGERRWLDAARRAASQRVQGRYAEGGEFTLAGLPHDHWLAYALAELAELDPDPADAPYLRRLATSIAMLQNDHSVAPDWDGGFYSPPRSAPTATRAEALASILAVLPAGDAAVPSAQDSLCRALAFQLRSQFGPERSFYLADPQRAFGGISRSLTDYSIRIDYPQHTSSSLLAAARLQVDGRLDCPEKIVVSGGRR